MEWLACTHGSQGRVPRAAEVAAVIPTKPGHRGAFGQHTFATSAVQFPVHGQGRSIGLYATTFTARKNSPLEASLTLLIKALKVT